MRPKCLFAGIKSSPVITLDTDKNLGYTSQNTDIIESWLIKLTL